MMHFAIQISGNLLFVKILTSPTSAILPPLFQRVVYIDVPVTMIFYVLQTLIDLRKFYFSTLYRVQFNFKS